MIDHEVKHQVVVLAEGFHIVKCAERLVHLFVGDGRKSTVCRRREKRQDMHTADGVVIIPVQHRVEFLQIFSHAVRIGNQHNLVVQFFHHTHPVFHNISFRESRTENGSARDC